MPNRAKDSGCSSKPQFQSGYLSLTSTVSEEAHQTGIHRMLKAGATPMTSTQYVLELQRDWGRSATYQAVTDLFKDFGGAYGIGIQYSREIIKH